MKAPIEDNRYIVIGVETNDKKMLNTFSSLF